MRSCGLWLAQCSMMFGPKDHTVFQHDLPFSVAVLKAHLYAKRAHFTMKRSKPTEAVISELEAVEPWSQIYSAYYAYELKTFGLSTRRRLAGRGPCIAKVLRSPAKRTKILLQTPSLDPSPPPPPPETNKCSHFRLQLSYQCVYKTPLILKPEVRFFRNPHPQAPKRILLASAHFCDGPLLC